MKQLIINADDYGRSPNISRGIREAHRNGIVTSTTCMMNIPTTAQDVTLAMEETPRLGMGVHLVLTMGRPILPRASVPTLVDADGNHFKYNPFIANLPRLKMDEVKAEWRAQIEAFTKAAGRKPDHLDSHHHSSYFSTDLFRAMLEIAQEYGCPIRNPAAHGSNPMGMQIYPLMQEFKIRTTDSIFTNFYDDGATKEDLLNIIELIEDGKTYELMCHPGHVDEAFANESIYNFQREREWKIVTDPEVKQAIAAQNIELINFANL